MFLKRLFSILAILLIFSQQVSAYSDASFSSIEVGWRNDVLYAKMIPSTNLTNFYLGSDASGDTNNFLAATGYGISVYKNASLQNLTSGQTYYIPFGKQAFCGHTENVSQEHEYFDKNTLYHQTGGNYDLTDCITSGSTELTHIYTLRYWSTETGKVEALSYPSNMLAFVDLNDPEETSTPSTSTYLGNIALHFPELETDFNSLFQQTLPYIFSVLVVLIAFSWSIIWFKKISQ